MAKPDKEKKPKPDKKPKKKDYHIQIKADGATVGSSLICNLSGFDAQTKTAEDTKVAFNFKTKKGSPAITEGQVLAGDINGQVFNVTITKKQTKVNISLANGGTTTTPPA